MKFIVYKDAKNEFRWRLIARNGKIVADSSESYKRQKSCDQIILKILNTAWTIKIEHKF
jgi:uncharacterized protein